jgi:glycosyltransferase involved in cell wall biosynthesis
MLTSVVAANSLSQPSRQPSDGLIRLLGIGGLVPLKNWGRAIESMSELPQSYVLEIAGEGPDRRRLEALIARRGLGNRVRLLGHRSDVPQLLADCDVVVHPSFVETFGFSLMEAAIAGKPVVCLDMPVMNELVPTVIPGVACPNSSLGLAEGIRRVVEQQAQGLLTASTEGEESPAFRIRDNREEVRAAWLELLQ